MAVCSATQPAMLPDTTNHLRHSPVGLLSIHVTDGSLCCPKKQLFSAQHLLSLCQTQRGHCSTLPSNISCQYNHKDGSNYEDGFSRRSLRHSTAILYKYLPVFSLFKGRRKIFDTFNSTSSRIPKLACRCGACNSSTGSRQNTVL